MPMFPENRKELRRCYTMVSLAMIASTALIELMSTLHSVIYYTFDWPIMYSDWYETIVNSLVIYPAGILGFGLILWRLPTPKLVGGARSGPRQIGQGILMGLGTLYAASMITQMLLANTNTYDYANESIAQEPLAVALVGSVILAPIFEELIFRKLLMDRLLFLGDWSALAISALFFGLFHTNLYQFLYATAVGFVLGYIHLMTGKMRWNIGLHMFINLFCGVLIDYLPDQDWIYVVLDILIVLSMAYVIYYLIRYKPWRNLHSGPMYYFRAADKWAACMSSAAFWICVVVHLTLSVLYIIQ